MEARGSRELFNMSTSATTINSSIMSTSVTILWSISGESTSLIDLKLEKVFPVSWSSDEQGTEFMYTDAT